jgi:hypothetical protein
LPTLHANTIQQIVKEDHPDTEGADKTQRQVDHYRQQDHRNADDPYYLRSAD